MAILAVLVLLIGNLANNATATTTTVRMRLESDNQARTVFDRMAQDFSGMLKRKDIDVVFSKQNGNDKMFFYSEAPAYYSNDPVSSKRSPVALVGYRISDKSQLQRLGKGLIWSDESSAASLNFLTYPSADIGSRPLEESTIPGRWKQSIGSAPNFDGVDRDYHTLGNQVCRLELCFQLKPSDKTVNTYSIDPYYPDHPNINGVQDIAAIIVTIAVLENSASSSDSEKSRLIAALPDPRNADLHGPPPKLTATLWKQLITSSLVTPEKGLSQRSKSRLRIYERSFNLNNQ